MSATRPVILHMTDLPSPVHVLPIDPRHCCIRCNPFPQFEHPGLGGSSSGVDGLHFNGDDLFQFAVLVNEGENPGDEKYTPSTDGRELDFAAERRAKCEDAC